MHGAAATSGQYLALSKAWWFCFIYLFICFVLCAIGRQLEGHQTIVHGRRRSFFFRWVQLMASAWSESLYGGLGADPPERGQRAEPLMN